VRVLELGDGALPTMDRVAVRLAAGAEWICPRSTANEIFAVVEGAGLSRIGDRQVQWERGDMLVVPGWNAQVHRADADAVLLRISDRPLMRAMGWFRT